MARLREELKDANAEQVLFFRRSIVALISISLLLLILLVNIYHLQIRSFDDYRTRSNDNRIRVVPIEPTRGLIYDRNHVLLAENRPVYNLEIIPEQAKNLQESVDRLIDLLQLEPESKERFFQEIKRNRRFKPILLAEQLDENQVAIFSVNQHHYPGVSIQASLRRYYPFGDTLTHSLGYVAKINTKDTEKLEKQGKLANYAATRDIGKQGVERYYEDLLHGQVGYQEVEVNNRGRVIRTLKYQPPVSGKDIVLNIDIQLQQEAERLLADRRGAIVMLEADTGAVLAMESSPSYDPNLFVNGISRKDYNQLLEDKNRPLINRTTQGIYAPGSTIKPMLVIMGLNENKINTTQKFFGDKFFQIPGTEKKFRDWKPQGHGWVNVYQAIAASVDTFFYDLAYRTGIGKIHEYMKKFGFGEYTGIDLYEESKANLPSEDWKLSRFKQPWYTGDTISVGIGQGYWTVTPLQLARAVSILVQRGQDVVPKILKHTVSHAQQEAEIPRIRLHRDVDWEVPLEGMFMVAHGKSGTARRVFQGSNYQVGGKSGTAQVIGMKEDEVYDPEKIKERFRDHALFVAFAPFDAPEVVISVILENAGGGSKYAAPVARQMLDKYFSLNTRVAHHEKHE